MRIQNQVQLSNGDKVKLGNTSIDWNRIIQQPEKTVVSAGKGQVIIPPDVKDRRSIGRSSEAQVRLNLMMCRVNMLYYANDLMGTC